MGCMENLGHGDGETKQTRVDPMPYRHSPTSLALSFSQETEVASLTEEVGLDPTEFRWSAQPSRYHLGRLVSVLVHIPTGTSFRFEFIESALGQNRVSVFMPGDHSQDGRKGAASWEEQLRHVREWLTRLIDAKK
jgi:hypothetical protein